ncbi:LacI family DNA-binding transcriptional regulator [Labrys sp. KNU-23]|nr:LacI family DNA-binding transcriptional regulator [Labrys sp. KNU-23]QEN85881.1 LacI family DNA-binding transcriptional regulator [Labrys sp. KNU-23]
MRGIPKTRFCTIAQIANRTGLGTTTVFRALRNERYISVEVREAISLAVHDLNEKAIRRYREEVERLR